MIPTKSPMPPAALKLLEALALRPSDKIEVLLVALGEKPSTLRQFRSATWEEGETPQPIHDEQFESYLKVLHASGLAVEVTSEEIVNPTREILKGTDGALMREWAHNTDWDAELAKHYRQARRTVFVARDQPALERIKRAHAANDAKQLGEAYGFPPTAVDAYLHNAAQSPHATAETDPAVFAFAQFGVSKNHWAEELQTAKRWSDAVKRTSPALFDARMHETRK